MPTTVPIKSYSTTTCALNDKGYTAFVITVDGTSAYTTFITLDVCGSLPTTDGHVGACQCLECAHNKDLLCSASGVTVVDGVRTFHEVR